MRLTDCPHRRPAAAPGAMLCAIAPAIGQVAGEGNPNCPCYRCVEEWKDGAPPSEPTPVLIELAQQIKEATENRPAAVPARPDCIHLGPVFDRADCECPRKHRRFCSILGETTLNGCDGCTHHIADDPSIDREDAREPLILSCSLSPGDVVVMTAAVRELHRQYPGQFRTDVRTPHPDIWRHSPLVSPIADRDGRRIDMHYPLINQSNQRPVHFLEGYCEYLAGELGLPSLRPQVYRGDIWLSKEESESLPRFDGAYWLINAGSKSDFTCKQWPVERFQAVVDHFAVRIQFVQVGAAEPGHRHQRLRGVVDLVGKTTCRELILLTYHAAGVLTPVSFPMHLAAAVPRPRGVAGLRPCVVVAGGREPAHWEQYPGHQFLHTIGQLPCCSTGGCWRSKVDVDCDMPVEGYSACMRAIEVEDVIRAIEGYLNNGSSGPVRARSGAPDDANPDVVVSRSVDPRPNEVKVQRHKVGVVIGSFNMPSVLRLNVAAIRHHCGPDVPILIADDCSDGSDVNSPPGSNAAKIYETAMRWPNVSHWPSMERIGHAGGDLSAFWKGLQWAKNLRLDVLVKLSQRYIIDIPFWTDLLADELYASGLSTIGRGCSQWSWGLRTECVGMKVARWATPEILAHLHPRKVGWPAEPIVFDDVKDRLEGSICQWSLMSPARNLPAPGMLFREANRLQEYQALGERLGVPLDGDLHVADSVHTANYRMG